MENDQNGVPSHKDQREIQYLNTALHAIMCSKLKTLNAPDEIVQNEERLLSESMEGLNDIIILRGHIYKQVLTRMEWDISFSCSNCLESFKCSDGGRIDIDDLPYSRDGAKQCKDFCHTDKETLGLEVLNKWIMIVDDLQKQFQFDLSDIKSKIVNMHSMFVQELQ